MFLRGMSSDEHRVDGLSSPCLILTLTERSEVGQN